MNNGFYILSDQAEMDVENIFEYSVSEFGVDKAIEYHLGLINLFTQLTIFPEEGKSRNEIKFGLRSIAYISHIVFYRILPENIRIVRILHHSQNAQDYFK